MLLVLIFFCNRRHVIDTHKNIRVEKLHNFSAEHQLGLVPCNRLENFVHSDHIAEMYRQIQEPYARTDNYKYSFFLDTIN